MLDAVRSLPSLDQLLRGTSYRELSRMTGLHHGRIWYWLHGHRARIDLHDGLSLALALGCDPHVLSAFIEYARVAYLARVARRRAAGKTAGRSYFT